MKIFYFKNKINFNFSNIVAFFLLTIFSIILISCDSTVSLQIVRPPAQKIEQIEFLEVGNFELVRGEINSENFLEPASKTSLN